MKIIHFENTNLSIHEPHKIIFSNNDSYFVLINYENNSTLYDKKLLSLNEIKTDNKSLIKKKNKLEKDYVTLILINS